MQVTGDYQKDGYAKVERLIPPEVAAMLVNQLNADLEASGQTFNHFLKQEDLMRRPTVEISGHFYRPLITFLWGLTPIVSELTGVDLLPSYDYFRIYTKDEICRVHSDRPSCEHSVSLTLGYSDALPWDLQIGSVPVTGPDYLHEDFGDEPFASIAMQPGDAVLYRGTTLRHGRIEPNPNQWSAHLFLHWVERNGEHHAHAFDSQRITEERQRLAEAQAEGAPA